MLAKHSLPITLNATLKLKHFDIFLRHFYALQGEGAFNSSSGQIVLWLQLKSQPSSATLGCFAAKWQDSRLQPTCSPFPVVLQTVGFALSVLECRNIAVQHGGLCGKPQEEDQAVKPTHALQLPDH